MNEQEMRAVFLLAKYDVKGFQRLENRYWPIPETDDPRFEYYTTLRENSPWWEVTTQFGNIVIGKRKRVYSLNWDQIGRVIPEKLTSEDVTRFDFCIHAWSLAKVVEYLNTLRQELEA